MKRVNLAAEATELPILHLAHANGFPPGCYQELADDLAGQYRVICFPARPLWDNPPSPAGFSSWQIAADDLVAALDDASFGPIVAIGHSLGAVVTLLAARQHPALFECVVALDPVLFPRWFVWMMTAGPTWIPRPQLPLVERTLRRRREWPSFDAAFERYRQRALFEKWSDVALKGYIDGITVVDSDGCLKLIYTPEWEAQIYRSAMTTNRGWWRWLRDIECPVAVVMGGQTDTFRQGSRRRWQRTRPDFPVHIITEGGHLFPMEYPQQTAQIVLKLLDELRSAP